MLDLYERFFAVLSIIKPDSPERGLQGITARTRPYLPARGRLNRKTPVPFKPLSDRNKRGWTGNTHTEVI
jgi:hypothetical protein